MEAALPPPRAPGGGGGDADDEAAAAAARGVELVLEETVLGPRRSPRARARRARPPRACPLQGRPRARAGRDGGRGLRRRGARDKSAARRRARAARRRRDRRRARRGEQRRCAPRTRAFTRRARARSRASSLRAAARWARSCASSASARSCRSSSCRRRATRARRSSARAGAWEQFKHLAHDSMRTVFQRMRAHMAAARHEQQDKAARYVQSQWRGMGGRSAVLEGKRRARRDAQRRLTRAPGARGEGAARAPAATRVRLAGGSVHERRALEVPDACQKCRKRVLLNARGLRRRDAVGPALARRARDPARAARHVRAQALQGAMIRARHVRLLARFEDKERLVASSFSRHGAAARIQKWFRTLPWRVARIRAAAVVGARRAAARRAHRAREEAAAADAAAADPRPRRQDAARARGGLRARHVHDAVERESRRTAARGASARPRRRPGRRRRPRSRRPRTRRRRSSSSRRPRPTRAR